MRRSKEDGELITQEELKKLRESWVLFGSVASAEMLDRIINCCEASIRFEIEQNEKVLYTLGTEWDVESPEWLEYIYINKGLNRALQIIQYCRNLNNSPCKPRK